MKKIISIFLFFCILQPLFSQRLGGKLEYNFSSSQEMFERAQFLERRHNETKAHLDGIIDEILKLRASTNDKKFDEYLQKWYDYFNSFYNQGLAHENIRAQIYEGERKLKLALVDYNKSISIKNNSDNKTEINEVHKDDAISPYYVAFAGTSLLKYPLSDSPVIYNTKNGDLIAVVKESVDDWNYFYIKTKENYYGYILKSNFENTVIEDYSSVKYLETMKSQNSLEEAFNKYYSGEYDASYKIVCEIINSKNIDKKAYYLKGNIELYQKQNLDAAISDYSTCISEYPDSPFPYFQRGYAYELKKETLKSLQDFTISIKLDPNFLEAYYQRGIVKSELGDRYGAIKDYDYIIDFKGAAKDKFSSMATVLNNKAYCLIKLNKFQEAKPFIEKALELDKSKDYIWDTSGELNFHIGKYDECIVEMSKAIEIGESSNSYYYRGLAKIKLGHKEDGCLDLSKAGELGLIKSYEKIQELCK